MNTDNTPEQERQAPQRVTPGNEDNLPFASEAIALLENYQFNPNSSGGANTNNETKDPEDNDESTAPETKSGKTETLSATHMMFAAPAAKELPILDLEPWPHEGEAPNPVSVRKALKFFAAGVEKVDSNKAEAGVHGHAWIVEDKETWPKRSGTSKMTIPAKTSRLKKGTAKELMSNNCAIKQHRLYHHSRLEGQNALVEWFGAERFCDMHKKGILPPVTEPSVMLEHLKLTCGMP